MLVMRAVVGLGLEERAGPKWAGIWEEVEGGFYVLERKAWALSKWAM